MPAARIPPAATCRRGRNAGRAGALVHNRQTLWILDEPYVALDPAAIGVVVGLIGAHLQRGGLAVLTTHQPVELAAAQVRRLELRPLGRAGRGAPEGGGC